MSAIVSDRELHSEAFGMFLIVLIGEGSVAQTILSGAGGIISIHFGFAIGVAVSGDTAVVTTPIFGSSRRVVGTYNAGEDVMCCTMHYTIHRITLACM